MAYNELGWGQHHDGTVAAHRSFSRWTQSAKPLAPWYHGQKSPEGAEHVKNQLFYGDNLDILRDHIADESVDLIYLDPPFNSNRNYHVLFKGKEQRRITFTDRGVQRYMGMESG